MNPRRCGNAVPLEQMHPGDRELIANFRAFLRGEKALAADEVTFVDVDSSDAVYVVPPMGVAE